MRVPLKHFVKRHAKYVGDTKCHFKRRRIFACLDRRDRLSGHADAFTKFGLRHFTAVKTQQAYLRTLLIHGARAMLRTAGSKEDRLSRWVTRIAETRHHNIAAVALANKTARIAWAMITRGTDYEPDMIHA